MLCKADLVYVSLSVSNVYNGGNIHPYRMDFRLCLPLVQSQLLGGGFKLKQMEIMKYFVQSTESSQCLKNS